MLHLLFESGDGNSELKGRRFPLGKNIYAHLKETLDNYKGDKSVEGYKRLVNIINMNDNEGGILYNEMKRIKNFFDNYNGSKDSVNFILNGGEPMENWVRNTLNTAIETVKGFKQAKATGGLNNSFRKEHTKDRVVKPPKETKIKMSDINKNLLNVAESGFKITKSNKVKSSVNEGKTFYITEEQQRQLLTEITVRDKYEKEKTKTKWTNPRDFQRICQSDPTYNREKDIVGKYTNWLLLRLNDLSDLERVRVPLEWYADGMKHGILQRQGISPDINTYKSVDEFISAMQGIMKSDDEPMQSASEMNNREKFDGQFKLVGQSRYWEVISPLTFEAERWFGRKTEWCTVANEKYFERYGGYEGKLFIFYPRDGKLETRIQVHFGSESYFDVNDEGYDDITEALLSHNSDEDSVADGVNLANKLWDLGLKYTKLSDVPKLLAQGVDPNDIFSIIDDFSEGFARVMLNGKHNFLTSDGRLLSPDQWFNGAGDFYNGFAVVKMNNGKWNYLTTEGQIAFPDLRFDGVGDFYNGFARVKMDKGQIAIPDLRFDGVSNFSEELAWVIPNNDKWNFITTDGRILYKPNEPNQWFDSAGYFSEGFARVELNGKYYRLREDGVLCDFNTMQPIPKLNESKVNKRTFYINEEQTEKLKKNMLNEEIIKKNINSIINEELSISKDVEDISFEIFSNIKKHGFVKGEENFSFNVGDILVSCFNYYFNSREEYEKEKPQKSANSVSHRGIKFINIALCYLSGRLVSNDLYDSIFHEVEHLYQQEKSKLEFQKRKDDDFYHFVEGIMYNGKTLEERTVAAGLYLSFDYELNGYLNGLYGQLKETDPQPNEVDKIVKESALYQMISHTEEALKLLTSPDGDKYAESYTIKYNLPKKYLINRLKKTLKIAYKKIGKIIVKFKKSKLSIMRDVNLYENFWYKFR